MQDAAQPLDCLDCGRPVAAEAGERCPRCAVLLDNWRYRGSPGGDYAAWRRVIGYPLLWRIHAARIVFERLGQAESANGWRTR